MTEWTPGPWRVEWEPASDLDDCKQMVIRSPQDHWLALDINGEVNARLIAAAPELADLLDKALHWDHDCHWMKTTGDRCERCDGGQGEQAQALLDRIIQSTSPDTSVDREETE